MSSNNKGITIKLEQNPITLTPSPAGTGKLNVGIAGPPGPKGPQGPPGPPGKDGKSPDTSMFVTWAGLPEAVQGFADERYAKKDDAGGIEVRRYD